LKMIARMFDFENCESTSLYSSQSPLSKFEIASPRSKSVDNAACMQKCCNHVPAPGCMHFLCMKEEENFVHGKLLKEQVRNQIIRSSSI
jgi:hypothetical protein